MSIRLVTCLVALHLCSSAIPAQTVADKPPHPWRASALKLQAEGGSPEEWATFLAIVLDAGHFAAAQWWSDLAAEAEKAGKLEVVKPNPLSPHRARIPAETPLADPKLALRWVVHGESAANLKDPSEVGRAVRIAGVILKLAPDTTARRRLDALRPKAKPEETQAPTVAAEKKRKEGDALLELAVAPFRARIQTWLGDYEAAGCRIGRDRIHLLLNNLRSLHPSDPLVIEAENRMRAAVAVVEPPKRLAVMVRNHAGSVRLTRNGAELPRASRWSATDEAPVEIAVCAGDLIQIEISEPWSDADGKRLFVGAMGARLDDVEIPAESWAIDEDGSPEGLTTSLHKLRPTVKHRDPLPDIASDQEKAIAEQGGGWIELPGKTEADQWTYMPLYPVLVKHEDDFVRAKFPQQWFGIYTPALVLTLQIPHQ